MSYTQKVSVTDAITGEVTRIYEVKSSNQMSKKAAIHAVIDHQEGRKLSGNVEVTYE